MEEKLSSAAKNGNLEEVKRCVENDQVPVDCRFPTNDGPTALYWAACNGFVWFLINIIIEHTLSWYSQLKKKFFSKLHWFFIRLLKDYL